MGAGARCVGRRAGCEQVVPGAGAGAWAGCVRAAPGSAHVQVPTCSLVQLAFARPAAQLHPCPPAAAPCTVPATRERRWLSRRWTWAARWRRSRPSLQARSGCGQQAACSGHEQAASLQFPAPCLQRVGRRPAPPHCHALLPCRGHAHAAHQPAPQRGEWVWLPAAPASRRLAAVALACTLHAAGATQPASQPRFLPPTPAPRRSPSLAWPWTAPRAA